MVLGLRTLVAVRGPTFSAQRTHGGSQLSVTAVPGTPTPSSHRSVHCTPVVYIHAQIQNTPIK